MQDWSQLNEELLHFICKHLENCFDVVHARSVCRSWRSSFPFPCCLLRPSYSLPAFADFPQESKDLCTIEKVPLFFFRVQTPAAAELISSSLQCSVKVKNPGSGPIMLNLLHCQILLLGYQYRMMGWEPKYYRYMAFIPLKKEGGGEEFIVLLNYTSFLLVLRSAEMRWMQLQQISDAPCKGVVTFRGRFYAVFLNGDVFVIDPYSLEATPLMPSQPLRSNKYLIPSGNDELFMVERFLRVGYVLNNFRSQCRVSRLDEEAGKWVEVSDLGDRVLFTGLLGNVCCSAKELPDNCGVSGNSVLCSNEPGRITLFYIGPLTGRSEDDLNCDVVPLRNSSCGYPA